MEENTKNSTAQEYSVKLTKYPNYTFCFNRINVILGANGSGKSSTLVGIKNIAHINFKNLTTIYIEGGRTIRLPDSLTLNAATINNFSTDDAVESRHRKKKVRVTFRQNI